MKLTNMNYRDYKLAAAALHEKSKKLYTWKDIEKMRFEKAASELARVLRKFNKKGY